MAVKLGRIKILILSFFTSLIVGFSSAQGGNTMVDPDDTLFGIFFDWIFSLRTLPRDISGSSEWLSLISAFLLTLILVYKAMEFTGDKLLDGFHDKLSESLDSRGYINWYLALAFLGLLLMGDYLREFLLTIVLTIQTFGFIGVVISIFLLAGMLFAGTAYGAGKVGKGLEKGGNEFVKGTTAFWNSDPIKKGRSAANSLRSSMNNLGTTSSRYRSFSARTSKRLNNAVDNGILTGNNYYCQELHQNDAATHDRGDTCSRSTCDRVIT